MRIRALILLTFWQVLSFSAIAVYAQDFSPKSARSLEQSAPSSSALESKIKTLDRQILLELVKLAQFNVQYEQTVNHQARWRNLVYPLGQEAAYACFLGYSVTDLSQEVSGWNNTKIISPTSVKQGLTSAMLGSLFGCASSMLEMLANGAETVRANRQGFSGPASTAFVQSAVKRVDDMLEERHSLMEQTNLTGTHQELMKLKEDLLRYERDRLVFEFKRWNSHSRGYAWYKNSFYAINASVNSGRFSAILLGFKSFTNKRCGGATGPLLITSACLAALGPAASSTIGNWMERHQMRVVSTRLTAAPFLSDAKAKQKFERLAELLSIRASQDQLSPIAADLARLREEKIGLDKLIFHEERHIERTRLVAGQQAKTAPLISSLGTASGILGTIGYHAYRKNPVVNNRLGFAGDATIIPAEAVALYATPAAAISAYVYERNLRRKDEHPEQLRSRRLKDLKTLEAIINESSI